MDQWIGYNVSVNCGSPLGQYQGCILQTDGVTITLTKAFRNGFPYPEPHLTINAADIKELKIIEPKKETVNEKTHSTIAVSKSAKKPHRSTVSENLQNNTGSTSLQQNTSGNSSFQQIAGGNSSFHHSSGNAFQQSPGGPFHQNFGNSSQQNFGNSSQQNFGSSSQQTTPGSSFRPVVKTQSGGSQSVGQGASYKSGGSVQGPANTRSKPIEIQNRQNKNFSGSGSAGVPGTTPNKKDKQRRRNEAFAGTPGDDPSMLQEFDFEKNLALFDKRAIWKELKHSQKPDLLRQTDACGSKFRHDENVLTTVPAVYRAIHVPEDERAAREYVTDEGVVVPSVSARLRQELWSALEHVGLHYNTPTLLARAATDIALRLLGGGRRLDPRNAHQVPTVVVLVGAHKDGQAGVICARALASHGVRTVVHVSGAEPHAPLLPHLHHYRLAGPPHRVARAVRELPTADLIVVALAGHTEDLVDYQEVAEWTTHSRATVLALDPPAAGTRGIATKVSLLAALPLAHSPDNGKLYLANMAIPELVFANLGIQYKSPFGAKNVVALHDNDV